MKFSEQYLPCSNDGYEVWDTQGCSFKEFLDIIHYLEKNKIEYRKCYARNDLDEEFVVKNSFVVRACDIGENNFYDYSDEPKIPTFDLHPWLENCQGVVVLECEWCGACEGW